MNDESNSRTEAVIPALVIGYGNTLRGDDGVGPRVAGLIEAKRLEGVQTITCHQLTPELAEPVSRARLVIFVDAALDLPVDQVRATRAQPGGDPQVMIHITNPGGLLQLAEAVFNGHPEAWSVAVPVSEMGIGEELSAVAQRGVECAVERILELLQSEIA